MTYGWPLSGLRDDGSGRPLPEIGSLAGMSAEKQTLVRDAWIATAYSRLSNLTPEEKRLAQDKVLAREAAFWRVQFREMEKDRDHFKKQAEALEASNTGLGARLDSLLEALGNGNDPAESPAALEATG